MHLHKMGTQKSFKKLFLYFCIVSICNSISLHHSVSCDPMSTKDGDELLASLQNLDMDTKKITDFLNGYKNERTSEPSTTNIELHPSLWSSEYYKVVNPKTETQTVTFNQSSVQQPLKPISIDNKSGSENIISERNKTLQDDFLARLTIRNRKKTKERHQSSYKIQRESNDGAENELIGFGASSRTVIQPVASNSNTSFSGENSDNALKWIKTIGSTVTPVIPTRKKSHGSTTGKQPTYFDIYPNKDQNYAIKGIYVPPAQKPTSQPIIGSEKISPVLHMVQQKNREKQKKHQPKTETNQETLTQKYSSSESFDNHYVQGDIKLQHISNDNHELSNNMKLTKQNNLRNSINNIDELPASSTEFIPVKNFDNYLLTNYGPNGESNILPGDYFKPSKRDPELVQMIVMPKKFENSTTLSRNDAFGVAVTPLPGPPINQYKSNKNEIAQKLQVKNKKPFVAKSYQSNVQRIPFHVKPNNPKKSLGYQAAKMAEKYRNKRRNKKKRKVRKKHPRQKNHSRLPIKPLPSTFSHIEAEKRNIGVSVGITGERKQNSQTFAQNPAEDFYYKLPTHNGIHELENNGYNFGHTISYSSPSHQLYQQYQAPVQEPTLTTSDLDGTKHSITFEDESLSYQEPIDPYDPNDNALLLLGPNGPRMPILNRLVSDMSNMVRSNMDPSKESLSSKLGNSMYDNGMYVMNKIAGGTVDGEMDIFDFLPILGVIIGGALLLAGLFPNALSSFGLNNGSIVLGRKVDAKRGRTEEKETMFGATLNHLEAGMMLMNAIRLEDGTCTEKLACQMSETFQKYSDNPLSSSWILNAVNHFAPKSFHSSKFSKSFRMVLENNDKSSCNKECYRCVAL